MCLPFSCLWPRPVGSVALAAVCGTGALLDHVMVDPFRHQPPGLVQRGFGMVDAVKGRAGMESRHIAGPNATQFLVGGDYGTLTFTSDATVFNRHDAMTYY